MVLTLESDEEVLTTVLVDLCHTQIGVDLEIEASYRAGPVLGFLFLGGGEEEDEFHGIDP